MVKRGSTLYRCGFSLIELIFAIVVISMAMLTLPMIAKIVAQGTKRNIVQEAIFAASAELTGATAYYWDKNSMYDSDISRLSRVIDIDGDCENNASSPRYRLRDGHIAQPYHRRCLEDSAISLANIPDALFPNLNNAVHTSEVIFTNTTTNPMGYKESYTSAVTIANENERGDSDNNVKKITLKIFDANGDTLSVLNTYGANIGEVDYYKRRY